MPTRNTKFRHPSNRTPTVSCFEWYCIGGHIWAVHIENANIFYALSHIYVGMHYISGTNPYLLIVSPP